MEASGSYSGELLTAKDLLFRPRRSVTGHCPGLEGVQGEEGLKLLRICFFDPAAHC